MSDQSVTAEQAYHKIAGRHLYLESDIVPLATNTPFVCPYCRVFADHRWGIVTALRVFPTDNSVAADRHYDIPKSGLLASAVCLSCDKEVIFFEGKVIVPATSTAPVAVVDMPAAIQADFEEARSIVSASPRGAAALLRLAIQKLLPILGATKPAIDAAIAELVASKVIDERLQRALDTVRVIGNEAVHPGELDLKDDAATAIMLFRLVNFIVEQAITQPKEFDALYQGLPQKKLDGIANRDKGKP